MLASRLLLSSRLCWTRKRHAKRLLPKRLPRKAVPHLRRLLLRTSHDFTCDSVMSWEFSSRLGYVSTGGFAKSKIKPPESCCAFCIGIQELGVRWAAIQSMTCAGKGHGRDGIRLSSQCATSSMSLSHMRDVLLMYRPRKISKALKVAFSEHAAPKTTFPLQNLTPQPDDRTCRILEAAQTIPNSSRLACQCSHQGIRNKSNRDLVPSHPALRFPANILSP